MFLDRCNIIASISYTKLSKTFLKHNFNYLLNNDFAIRKVLLHKKYNINTIRIVRFPRDFGCPA